MPLNFAHRGSMTEAPENTLPAFQKAIDHGAKAIELDVQLTKDNHLIISHDHKLNRLNQHTDGLIKDFTLDEIRQIDVGSSFSETFAGIRLATLEDVLQLCPSDLLLNIEIKNIPVIYNGIEEILLKALRAHDRLDNVIISSFDHAALQNVRAMDPNVDLGMLFYYRMLQPWDYADRGGLNIRSIHPNHVYVDQTFVQFCKQRGLEVYPFTVNDPERYRELVSFGVDGVFSNEPGLFGGE